MYSQSDLKLLLTNHFRAKNKKKSPNVVKHILQHLISFAIGISFRGLQFLRPPPSRAILGSQKLPSPKKFPPHQKIVYKTLIFTKIKAIFKSFSDLLTTESKFLSMNAKLIGTIVVFEKSSSKKFKNFFLMF